MTYEDLQQKFGRQIAELDSDLVALGYKFAGAGLPLGILVQRLSLFTGGTIASSLREFPEEIAAAAAHACGVLTLAAQMKPEERGTLQ